MVGIFNSFEQNLKSIHMILNCELSMQKLFLYGFVFFIIYLIIKKWKKIAFDF